MYANSADPRPPAPTNLLREMDRRRVHQAIAAGIARTLGAATVLLLAYAMIPLGGLSEADLLVRILLATLIVIATVAWQIWAVDKARLPQIRAVEALVVSVSVTVVAFATAYLNLSRHDPAAFTEPLGKTSSLYFTLTTLTTIGYGDIAAVTDTARIAVMVQMVANVVVIGASAKAIIGMARYRMTTPREDSADPKR
jgi:voltage-gated potassium channel